MFLLQVNIYVFSMSDLLDEHGRDSLLAGALAAGAESADLALVSVPDPFGPRQEQDREILRLPAPGALVTAHQFAPIFMT